MKVAVVGGGWAGLTAAVTLVQRGSEVTLFEMAAQLGGRARRIDSEGLALDNGQHIMIGAYSHTLSLMRELGVDADKVLRRSSLELMYPQGHGLRLPPGAPLIAFARGVLGHRGWTVGERIRLLLASLRWALDGFDCDPGWSVDQLASGLPRSVREDLIDPLCVAALNTPAPQASARVFLRVLKDALFSGPGSADLLLPRAPLDALLPAPAHAWLQARGAELHLSERVMQIAPHGEGWTLDGRRFDAVVLAASALETSRLVESIAPDWAAKARAMRYEPIVTVYVQAPGVSLPWPMLALHSDARAPAQFVFDHGALRGERGLMAFVISGAAPWLERGAAQTSEAVLAQAARNLPGWPAHEARVLRVITEKRATFACIPGLQRPPCSIAPRLAAAGDYVEGPYPATLEGAVRAGLDAARVVS